jgi:lysophospholipase L1-like esterase
MAAAGAAADMRASGRTQAAQTLAALLLVLACAACTERGATLPKLARDDVILAFGDSLTAGVGAAEHESYPAVLGGLIGHDVVRSGVPGELTAQALQRLPEAIEEHRPKLVIVCIGGNDMLRRLSLSDARANVRAMLKTLKDRDIAAVLIGVPQPALLSSPPAFYAELAAEFAIPYEGEILKTVLFTADLKADPVHPNAGGYRRIAEALAVLLRKSGAL